MKRSVSAPKINPNNVNERDEPDPLQHPELHVGQAQVLFDGIDEQRNDESIEYRQPVQKGEHDRRIPADGGRRVRRFGNTTRDAISGFRHRAHPPTSEIIGLKTHDVMRQYLTIASNRRPGKVACPHSPVFVLRAETPPVRAIWRDGSRCDPRRLMRDCIATCPGAQTASRTCATCYPASPRIK